MIKETHRGIVYGDEYDGYSYTEPIVTGVLNAPYINTKGNLVDPSGIGGDMDSILNRMEIALENSTLDDTQVANLRKKLKEFEVSIKEKIKPKTITVSGSSHRKMKRYCESLNLKIGEWAEKTLLNEIENSSAIIMVKEDFEKESSELVKKYMDERSKKGILVKIDQLILDKDFKFRGYSCLDCKPIYEYFGSGILSDIIGTKFSCNILDMPRNLEEISSNFFDESMDIEIERNFTKNIVKSDQKYCCGEILCEEGLCEEHFQELTSFRNVFPLIVK